MSGKKDVCHLQGCPLRNTTYYGGEGRGVETFERYPKPAEVNSLIALKDYRDKQLEITDSIHILDCTCCLLRTAIH